MLHNSSVRLRIGHLVVKHYCEKKKRHFIFNTQKSVILQAAKENYGPL